MSATDFLLGIVAWIYIFFAAATVGHVAHWLYRAIFTKEQP